MDRMYIDCREFPKSQCSLKISGTEQEVVNAAVDHAIKVHGHRKTKELRDKLRRRLKKDVEINPNVAGYRGKQFEEARATHTG